MKRALCVILSVIMILPLGVLTVSACECNSAPVVHVRGFGSGLDLTLDDGTVKRAFPMGTDEIKKSVPYIVKTLTSLVLTKDYDTAADGIISIIETLMGILRCDSNGTSVYNLVSFGSSPTDVDKHTDSTGYFTRLDHSKSREYVFEYDWRLDPMQLADQLNNYIQQVKSVTGHDKVVLSAHSEGNNVAVAYLKKYGTRNIEKTLFLSAAFNGLKLVGKLFTKDLTINGKLDQLEDFLRTFIGDEPAGALATSVVSILNDRGILDSVNNELSKLVEQKIGYIYDAYLIDMFATMPGIWSFVPDEYYETAKVRMFGSDAKYSTLIKTIDTYHYDVQCNLKNILTSVKNAGIPVSIVTGYGISPIPVYEDSNEQCDMLIDTKYTSAGATCAKVGEKLVKSDSKYLSADLMIDASTCLFPDSTWFVKYQDHNEFCDPYCEFLSWIILYNGQPTVFTNPDYPQFMICRSHDKLSPVNENDDIHNSYSDIIVLLTSIIALLKQAISSLIAKVPSFSK